MWTDGSGHVQSAYSWAWVAVMDDIQLDYNWGADAQGTANMGELEAVIQALTWANQHHPASKLHVYTDSQYVYGGFAPEHKWVSKWLRNNWKNGRGRRVANKDMWLRLLTLTDNLDIIWHKVSSHSGLKWNDMADEMAGKARARCLGSQKTINVSTAEQSQIR